MLFFGASFSILFANAEASYLLCPIKPPVLLPKQVYFKYHYSQQGESLDPFRLARWISSLPCDDGVFVLLLIPNSEKAVLIYIATFDQRKN
jgi:hypothetical protein